MWLHFPRGELSIQDFCSLTSLRCIGIIKSCWIETCRLITILSERIKRNHDSTWKKARLIKRAEAWNFLHQIMSSAPDIGSHFSLKLKSIRGCSREKLSLLHFRCLRDGLAAILRLERKKCTKSIIFLLRVSSFAIYFYSSPKKHFGFIHLLLQYVQSSGCDPINYSSV